jgi:type IV secretory pathway TraG/TraD family ATPase VirD4
MTLNALLAVLALGAVFAVRWARRSLTLWRELMDVGLAYVWSQLKIVWLAGLMALITRRVLDPPLWVQPWAMTLGWLLFAIVIFKMRTPVTPPIQLERGTRVDSSGDTPTNAHAHLSVAGVEIHPDDETKHFKFIGTTGTGKSTAITELMDQALRRGDRAVIADPDGGYCRRWYCADQGDVILNPFDARSAHWDLYRELKNIMDYDSLAQALIPGVGRSDAVWSAYARVFLSELLKRTHHVGIGHLSELLRLVQVASRNELRVLLQATPAAPFLEDGNERMFSSIRSVCMSALSALQYLPAPHERAFSVRDWVGSSSRALYLPYHANEISSLKTLISTWMRLVIDATLSRGFAQSRVWFVVDELDALGAIDGLKDALVRLRKHGGCCVLGFQSIGQLVGTYGEQDAKTIGENCATTLILRCSGSGPGGTARYGQELIGERQVLRRHEASTRPRWFGGMGGLGGRSVSQSWQRNIEPAVLASEIEQLPDLQGFLKTAVTPYWRRVRLQPPS